MLAPRKKLWSTPSEVIEVAISLLQITDSDIVYDIGAGDCRFLLRCRESTGATCVGVEIDTERAELARRNILDSGYSESECLIVTGNALEQVPKPSLCSVKDSLTMSFVILRSYGAWSPTE
jgi:precorrin-6B methylase 2